MGELKGVKPYDGEFDEEENEEGLPSEDDEAIPLKLPGRKRKRRGLKDVGPQFWSPQRVFIAFVFLLGLVLGGFLVHQYIEPELNRGLQQDVNAMQSANQALDKRVDYLIDCLHSEKINPDTCLRTG